jgi:hypothetical protein
LIAEVYLFDLFSWFLNTNNVVISGFRRGINEMFIIPGSYTARVTSQKKEDLKNYVLYE